MNIYDIGSIAEKLAGNTYPGRGIVLGLTPDGTRAVAAYFIMGRSVNSRNRVFLPGPPEGPQPHHLPPRARVRRLSHRHQR